MASIIHRLRDRALGLMQLEDISHAPVALTDRIIDDANRAHAKISAFLDDTFHFEEQRGVFVQPITTLTATVTRGLFTLGSFSGQSWMNGCTCMVGDSVIYNRLRKNPGTGTFELALPFLGTSGAGVQVQIWHDAVSLPADVMRIKGPFRYDNNVLQVTDAKYLRDIIGQQRTVGIPTQFAEITMHGGDEAQFLALLLDQIPGGNSVISYTAVGRIANFTSLDDTREHTVPFDLEASILFPLFSFYLSSFPLFEGSKEELGTDFQEAIFSLKRLPRKSAMPHRLKRPKR